MQGARLGKLETGGDTGGDGGGQGGAGKEELEKARKAWVERKMWRGGYGERGRKGEVCEAGGNWRLHGSGNTGTLRGTPRRQSSLKSKNVGSKGLI